MAEAASLYWVADLKIEQIGERLFLSRSTVSRLLKRARECGVVEFTVHHSPDDLKRLAAQIGERCRVRAHVVPDDAEATPLHLVAQVAAQQIGRLMAPGLTAAVGWGSTVDAISQALEPRPTPNTRVVQLDGAGSVSDVGTTYFGQILHRFGRAYGSEVTRLPMPALFDAASTREAMFRERSVQHALSQRRRADLLVASVGTVLSDRPGHLYRAGYLSPEELDALRLDGVVGDVGSMFFRTDGSSEGIAVNERSTGLDLDQLRRIPNRVIAATGEWKAPALAGALAAGLATDLVVDEGAARGIVRILDQG